MKNLQTVVLIFLEIFINNNSNNFSIIKRTIIILLIGSILSITSCKKETLPAVTTSGVIGIIQTSAYSGGEVTSDGNVKVTARDVCWNTSSSPTISDSHIIEGVQVASMDKYSPVASDFDPPLHFGFR